MPIRSVSLYLQFFAIAFILAFLPHYLPLETKTVLLFPAYFIAPPSDGPRGILGGIIDVGGLYLAMVCGASFTFLSWLNYKTVISTRRLVLVAIASWAYVLAKCLGEQSWWNWNHAEREMIERIITVNIIFNVCIFLLVVISARKPSNFLKGALGVLCVAWLFSTAFPIFIE